MRGLEPTDQRVLALRGPRHGAARHLRVANEDAKHDTNQPKPIRILGEEGLGSRKVSELILDRAALIPFDLF